LGAPRGGCAVDDEVEVTDVGPLGCDKYRTKNRPPINTTTIIMNGISRFTVSVIAVNT